MNLPGQGAIVGLVAAGGIIIANLKAPVDAMLTPAPGAPVSLEEGAGNLAARMDDRIAMINGRSLFFIPAEPPPPAPPPRQSEEPRDPGPPPPPSRYAGPKLIAMINDVAWFNDGSRLGVEESKGDLVVKRLVPPWEVVVEWKEVEFTVSLFKRDVVVLPNRETDIAQAADQTEDTQTETSQTSDDTAPDDADVVHTPPDDQLALDTDEESDNEDLP